MYNSGEMARREARSEMSTLEERVAYLEGRIEDHTGAVSQLRDDLRQGMSGVGTELAELRTGVRSEMAELRAEMAGLRTAVRIEVTDLRTEMVGLWTGLRSEMGGLRTDLRTEMGGLHAEMSDWRQDTDRQVQSLNHKIDRHFVWLIGIQVTVLVAIVAALVGT
jgi:predicted  nucleic acid-binding Zn-ribbon protein